MTVDALAFLDRAFATFEHAVAVTGVDEVDLSIAGDRVRLRFAGPALQPLFLRAMEHLRVPVDPTADVALTISVFDSETTGVRMPPPPWTQDDYRPKGEIAGCNDDRVHTQFEPGVDLLHLYDAERRVALLWAPAPEVVPWWEPTFPFRTILHWWCAPSARQPAHAGAVGCDGRGVLLTGPSGSGKSTASLACLAAGLDYGGDDYVLVDSAAARVYCLYSTAKLEPDNMERFPELRALVSNAERLHEEKAIVYLQDFRQDLRQDHQPLQIVPELELCGIVVPQVTGLPASEIVPLAPSAALQALAPTTTFHLPRYGREVFTKLSALVREVPCYQLRAGTDLAGVAAAVDGLVRQ